MEKANPELGDENEKGEIWTGDAWAPIPEIPEGEYCEEGFSIPELFTFAPEP